MYSICSSAASGFTMSASEPWRNTIACSTASSSGCTPSSGGITGKTAAPSGTSGESSGERILLFAACGLALASAKPQAATRSTPRNRGDNAQFIAVLRFRGQVVEVADVLVVQIDIQERLNLPAVENLRRQRRELLAQIIERRLNGRPAGLNGGLALRVFPQRGGDLDFYGHKG